MSEQPKQQQQPDKANAKQQPAKTEQPKQQPAKTEQPAKQQPAKTEQPKQQPAKTEQPKQQAAKVVDTKPAESKPKSEPLVLTGNVLAVDTVVGTGKAAHKGKWP